jgi:formylglycine-generating enzyme required for sulfatase activity/Leucine-rich repeat (LRR) protein
VPTLTRCPDDQVLERLLLGDISAEDAENLEQHLAECPPCTTKIATLQAEDTLLDAVRAAGPGKEAAPTPEIVNHLINRLKKLAPIPAAETPTEPPTHVPLEEVAPADDLGFLAPAEQADEIGRLGGYRVLKVLGSGGMGIVFLAEDVRLERRVALKVMQPILAASPSARERFLREARAAAALKHDHVVTIFQVGEDRGVPFLAMELLEGESLEDRLHREPCLPTEEVLRIGTEVARGLAAAHQRGLIHRDIKPGNIWLEADTGRTKIVDFGLARAAGNEPGLTKEGAIVGTPHYMAPEQGAGQAVDARSDLFSLGCVLYRMTTGQLPFKGTDAISTLMSVANDNPTPPHQVSPAVPVSLSDLVMRLLAKKREDRPATAAAVLDVLRSVEPATVSDASQKRPAGRRRFFEASLTTPRRRRLVVIAAVILLALVPLAYFFGGTVIRFATNKGELVIVVDDGDVEVAIRRGQVELTERSHWRTFVVTAGAGEVDVYEKGGGIKLTTKQFTLSRGGKTTVSVTAEVAEARKPVTLPPEAQPAAARRAAEWVLNIGGQVSLDFGDLREPAPVKRVADLPREAFRFWDVDLTGNQQVTDKGLEQFRGLRYIYNLYLDRTPTSDAALAHVGTLIDLYVLRINETRVGDRGLAHLQKLPRLKELHLGGNQVSDAGLVHLAKLFELRTLSLARTQVGDGGIGHLRALTNLEQLFLDDTRLTDAGLEHVRRLKGLKSVGLRGTRVTAEGIKKLREALPQCWIESDRGEFPLVGGDPDRNAGDWAFRQGGSLSVNGEMIRLSNSHVSDAGLVHLRGARKLRELHLDGTQVSDSGLEHLGELKQLTLLDLQRTKVTREGVKRVQTALPKCKIESDHGTFDPAADPARRANTFTNTLGMQFVLVPKGKAWLGGTGGAAGHEEVDFPHDFYLGMYEVTQEEWHQVMGTNPSDFSRTGKEKHRLKGISDADLKRFPVTNVSWDDSQEFITRLNEKLKESGWQYRLPNEKEWQYACRGGPLPKKEDYAFDFYFDRPMKELLRDWANFNNLLKRPAKVGSYPANSLGLHDMHGNVAEWCEDAVPHSGGAPWRATRGGSWTHPEAWCRATSRVACPQGWRAGDAGLRLVRAPVSAASDRPAAEHVLKLHGRLEVTTEGRTVSVQAGGELPATPFVITSINLRDLESVRGGQPLPPGSLEPLAGLKGLKWLSLEGAQITGEDLAHVRGLTSLVYLHLGGARITDADLVHLRDLTNLTFLNLDWNGNLTGAGFHHLKGLTKLRTFAVYVTGVTDDGLNHLADLPNLEELIIHRTQVTGVHLPRFKSWSKWRTVRLVGNPPTSLALLQALNSNPNLEELGLSVEWTDDNLAFLSGLKQLQSFTLNRQGAKVTDRGVAHLRGLANLRSLSLDGADLTDAALDHVQEMKSLRGLEISGAKITDKALERLAGLPELRAVAVLGCSITDAGLVHFQALPQLQGLYLRNTGITDAGLRHLYGLPRLDVLGVSDVPHLTAAGLAALRDSYPREFHVEHDKGTLPKPADDPPAPKFADPHELLKGLWVSYLTPARLVSFAGTDQEKVVGKLLELKGAQANRSLLIQGRHTAVRTRLKVLEGSAGLTLRSGQGNWYTAWFNGQTFGLNSPKKLLATRAVEPKDYAEPFELAFAAVGDRLMVFVKGKLLFDVRDDEFKRGEIALHVNGRAQFEAVEFIILDIHPGP